ncbi:MAG: adenosylcobinamide-GDP ribazoletransferase [Pseudomonadota bacterium]
MTDQTEDKSGARAGWAGDILLCLAFLSRLPVPVPGGHGRALSAAMRAFPAAGTLLGAMGGLICAAALWLSLPPAVAGIIAIIVLLFITGGLHEDGLADVADGFGGGATEERKLEIMKDSRIGSYGVLALGSVLLLKAAALAAILSDGPGTWEIVAMFAGLGALSRTCCVSLMATTANARGGGLASSAGQPSSGAHRIALASGILIAGVFLVHTFSTTAAIAVFIVCAAAFALVRSLAVRQIGGHTGDVAGAVQVATETAMLVCLSAFA